MGLESGFFEEVDKLLPYPPGRQWFDKRDSSAYFELGQNRTKLPDDSAKPVALVIDALGWLHKIWSSGSGQCARTIEDLAKVFIEKLDLYLRNPEVTLILFLVDKGSPNEKTVKRRQTSNTPATPFELLADGFVGTEEQKATAAWRIKLSQKVDTTDRAGLRMSGSNVSDSRYYLLPPPTRVLSQSEEKRTEYTYEECLENKHFKRWICSEVCRLVVELVKIPEGRQFIMSGPTTCVRKTAEGIDEPEDIFCHPYKEVDNSVGYWGAVLAEQYDVDIESEDGDCVITGLLGAHRRIRGNKHTVIQLDKVFRNRVRVIRNQWTKWATSVIDINNLYICLQYVHTALSAKYNVTIRNPIGNFALVAFAGGCDYVDGKMLPGIGKHNLIRTYFTHFSMFAQNLVSDHIARPQAVTVDVEAFTRYIICCFNQISGKTQLELPLGNVNKALEMLKPGWKKGPLPTTATLRVLVCNIAWTLTYFASGSVPKAMVPDGTMQIAEIPLYGYKRASAGPNAYGFYLVDFADDAYALHLNNEHHKVTHADPEQWMTNKIGELQNA